MDWKFVETRSEQGAEAFGTMWNQMNNEVRKWFSNLEKGLPTVELEKNIFDKFILLNSLGGVRETFTATQLEDDVKKFNSRLDSTNNLLLEVLKVVQKMQGDVEFMRTGVRQSWPIIIIARFVESRCIRSSSEDCCLP